MLGSERTDFEIASHTHTHWSIHKSLVDLDTIYSL